MGARLIDSRVVGAALAAALTGCVVWAALARGIWLDEFWALHFGRADVPLATLITQDWARDTHPALANALYRIVTALGVEGIGARRLALNLPALALMLGSALAYTRALSPAHRLFPLTLLLLVAGLPDTVASFADYRSYGWQIAGMVVLLCHARWLTDEARHEGWWLNLFDGIGIVATVALHYIAGLVASVFVALLILWLWRAGQRRDAVRIAIVAAVAWAITLVSAVVLLRGLASNIDHGWIKTSTGVALGLLTYMAVLVALANPVAAIVAATTRTRPDRFGWLLVAALIGSAILLLALNAVSPVMVQRYLIGWQVLLCGLVATLAVPALVARPLAFGAAGLAALVTLGLSTREALAQTGWDDNARWIAREVAACPTAHVHAVSAQRLTVIRDTKLSARESAMIGSAYHAVGRDAGVAVDVLPLTGPARLAPPDGCPTLLWIEHLDWAYVGDVNRLLRTGHFDIARPFVATVRTTPSGFVVRFSVQ